MTTLWKILWYLITDKEFRKFAEDNKDAPPIEVVGRGAVRRLDV